MEISPADLEGRRILRLRGRFDANWAGHVGEAIEGAIRTGHHEVDLDFDHVQYLSSAGIRVLVQYYKRLKAARGGLRVLRPAGTVRAVLELSGMAGMLVAAGHETPAPVCATAPPDSGQTRVRRWNHEGLELELHPLSEGCDFKGGVHGDPSALATGRVSGAVPTRLGCDPDLVAVGLGAFGEGREETRGRFGESLAVAGAVLSMPTDGSSVPDYQVAEDRLVPGIELLYGLSGRGKFAHLLRFEAGQCPRGSAGLSDLVQLALGCTSAPALAMVFVAESACVVGATLLRSPDGADGRSPLDFPGIRDWLEFTTERTDERGVVLGVGFVERNPGAVVQPFLRPVGGSSRAHGHFHAAVFPYRPLPKGRLDLVGAVDQLIQAASARSVMHLLADERPFEGMGQTDLMRGACWFSPWLVPSPATRD